MARSRTALAPRLCLALVLPTLGCPDPPLPPEPRVLTHNLFIAQPELGEQLLELVERRGQIALARADPNNPARFELVECPVARNWTYRPTPNPRIEMIQASTREELWAKLPLAGPQLAEQIDAGAPVQIEYLSTATFELTDQPKLPKNNPECRRATHVISTFSLGAFHLLEAQSSAPYEPGKVPMGGRAGANEVELCRAGELAFKYCYTPLQVLLHPLEQRDWVEDTVSVAHEHPMPETHAIPELKLERERWATGSYMALALQEMLAVGSRIQRRGPLALDDQGVALALGYLKPGGTQQLERVLEAGETYVAFATSALGLNIDLELVGPGGELVTADRSPDALPAIAFQVPSTGSYILQLRQSDDAEDFAALALTRVGGVEIELESMRDGLLRILDNGASASQLVREKSLGWGLLAYEPEFALQSMLLAPGERLSDADLRLSQPSVILAASHDGVRNIDLELVDQNSEQRWEDIEPDGNPLLVVDAPSPDTAYTLRMSYPAEGSDADELTLASLLVLELET